MSEIRILLVEDDKNFGDVLKSYLELHDYLVHLAKDGEEGFRAFQSGKFDLCILDVMMPKKDGFTLAKEIREKNTEVPIVFLTAKTLKEDILQGFKLGADDYISKPFNSEELLLRIQAVLRRSSNGVAVESEQNEFNFGRFHFNYEIRMLTFTDGGHSEETKLSPKEAHLLRLFCLNKSEVLKRSEALTKIWGEDNYFTARSMDVFITKLRKYLKRDSNIEIINIHGNGFRMVIKDGEKASV